MRRSPLALRFARILAWAWILASCGSAAAQYVEGRYWVTDGPVYAIVPTPDTVYLGGSFTQVGPATGGGVVLDTTTAQVREPFPLVDGVVYAVVPDGAGGWFLGGDFDNVASVPRRGLAHVDALGKLTAWDPGTNGLVRALLLRDGRVYVGGDFSEIGGVARTHLAAVDAVTGIPVAWSPNPNGAVWALTSTSSTTLFVGGEFTVIGGVGRGRVAEVNTTTASCTAFNPNANGPVFALWPRVTPDVGSSRLYIGGGFGTLGGQPRSGVGATDLFGALLSYAPNPDGAVYSIRIAPAGLTAHTVYLGGTFANVGGQSRYGLASTNAAGTVSSWNPVVTGGGVRSLLLAGSVVYAGGDFTSVGAVPRRRLAAIDGTGAALPFDPRPNGRVHALALVGTQLFAGGEMTSVGGVDRSRLAALDRRTGAATDWAPSADSSVHTMALHDGVVYVGGKFQFIDGLARFHLAGIDAASGVRTNFNPVANAPVYAMAVDGDRMFIGGEFTVVAGTLRNRLAALDIPTFTTTDWNPGADRTVFTLTLHTRTTPLPRSTVFAGGLFTTVAGQLRSRVAEIDRDTGAPTSWVPASFEAANQGYQVSSIVPFGPFVLVGGAFYDVGGQTRAGIAALYSDTGQLSGWNANTAFPCQVYAMALGGDGLYVGGYFSSIGGASRDGLAALNPYSAVATEWVATSTAGTLANSIATIVVDGSTLFVGGTFRSIAGSRRSGFVALSQQTVGVEESRVSGSSLVVSAHPNPSSSRTEIRWRLARPAVTDVVLFDARGRVVRRFPVGSLASGEHRLEWDGRDAEGRPVAAGVYFARVQSGRTRSEVKIVRVP